MRARNKRLAHVDIAQPGDDPLIQQRGLDRRFLPARAAFKLARRERVVQRLRTQPGQQPVPVLIARVGTRSTDPNRRGSTKPDAPAVIRSPAPGARAGSPRSGRAGREDHPSRHARDGAAPTRRPTAASGCISPAGETRAPARRSAARPARRQRPAQVRAVDRGARDHPALQPRLEAAHDGLDFGEFRHGGGRTL